MSEGDKVPGGRESQFTQEQQARARAVIESCAWGSMDDYILDMETALRRAMEATRDALAVWEARADDLGFEDEFELSADQVAELSDEWRLAYVARLLQTLALAYGVSPDTFENHESCPAALFRGLNDILWMPVTTERDAP
jgi:hypothetical protein